MTFTGTLRRALGLLALAPLAVHAQQLTLDTRDPNQKLS